MALIVGEQCVKT